MSTHEYNPQKKGGVKIVDFSEVPSDILPLIVSLVARLAFSLQQWTPAGKRHPVALFCDEAHLYIPERAQGDSASEISISIFERIAKEGRKYGVGLCGDQPAPLRSQSNGPQSVQQSYCNAAEPTLRTKEWCGDFSQTAWVGLVICCQSWTLAKRLSLEMQVCCLVEFESLSQRHTRIAALWSFGMSGRRVRLLVWFNWR